MSAQPHLPQRSRVARLVDELPPSGIRRFFDLVQATEGVISLGVGEPDFPTPWRFSTAAIDGLEAGRTTYTSNLGLLSLRRAIARHLDWLHGVRYHPDTEILVTVGVSEGLDLAFRAILEPGDEVIVPEPCFVAYTAAVRLAYGMPVTVDTHIETGFVPDPAAIERAVTPRTRAILLGSPSNPTGACIPCAVLQQIADIAARHDLIVVSDEIYDRLRYDDSGHTSFGTLRGAWERTILLNGFSKAYAMTGWRIGYACAPPDLLAAMNKIHQYTMMCAPIMAQEAALEALRHGEGAVADMVREYNQRRRFMVARLNQIGLACHEPLGAFYVFPSVRATGLDCETFCERLLREQKVAVVPGTAFGACGEGHLRATYAAGMDELREATARIERFLSSLR
ncbi:MAG: aminotransferase class I/II-fold pyridoxal phosphate-dependent enzyme [Armatimonadetes bacterium]|nr:aminotransferase class I/II-fold pyridoxal phosphate-dependent enzyme [Armatimonadota bacterium]